jgi:primosomal protein N' (replication factor Y)
MATVLSFVSGAPAAIEEVLGLLDLPPAGEVLGPVPQGDDGECRAVLRVPRSQGLALSRALGEVQRQRAARKLAAVRIQVDPPSL